MAQSNVCDTEAGINIEKAQECLVCLLKLLCVLQGCNQAPGNGLQQNLSIPTILY